MRRRGNGPAQPGLPLDPDLDPELGTDASRRPGLPAHAWGVFAGGVLGGLARYGLTQGWPTPTGAFPWPTFGVNTTGALALGMLLAILAGVRSPRRYLRPLLGTGFLGAFTTFSSVVVTTDELSTHGHAWTAALYLASSLIAGLAATFLGLVLGRSIGAAR